MEDESSSLIHFTRCSKAALNASLKGIRLCAGSSQPTSLAFACESSILHVISAYLRVFDFEIIIGMRGRTTISHCINVSVLGCGLEARLLISVSAMIFKNLSLLRSSLIRPPPPWTMTPS